MRKSIISILSGAIIFLISINDSIATHSCSINLMWVKKTGNDDKYIFPTNLPKAPANMTIGRISAWQRANPSCKINFWYDGKKTSRQQIENTITLLNDNELPNVTLKNLWEVKTVNTHENIFSDPVPLYFRVDLLRAVIADDLMDQGQERYVIYADLNIPPMENELLFDERTIRVLSKVGIMLSKNHAPHGEPYENGFFVLDRNNKYIKELHRQKLINWGLEKGSAFLKEYDQLEDESARKSMIDDFDIDQHVFFQYKPLWRTVSEQYISTEPSLQGKHLPIDQIIKEMYQPVSHLSQFQEWDGS